MVVKQCSLLLKSLGWCHGTPVRPGVRRRAYAIDASKIVKWPELTRDELGRVISSLLKGNFELAEGAKWAYIDHLPDKASFKSETQGEPPSQSFKVTAEIVHPGIGQEAADATAAFLNSNTVFLVQDMMGNYRLIGSDDYDSVVTSSRDNGQGPTGTAGTTISIEASMEVDAPIYTGEIVTEDGIINEGAGQEAGV